eukprot:CAMPEP_0201983524 /NCGR_PEP_ID=MMETSP0904-20121228/80590_1 /ASSEMBLY_ACC=CAM_ASM_000553 /TAXON_ID=420261 /ORGANISM="Thalassiosira antarctica, Strain CCMP982" /LENGTH=54 /DNA_ID=CAMNT_0048536661 /DNA_START=1 /DNA_END=161 /DNA_ORIENTATION=+
MKSSVETSFAVGNAASPCDCDDGMMCLLVRHPPSNVFETVKGLGAMINAEAWRP